MRTIVEGFAVLFALSLPSLASNVSLDVLDVSTISAQGGSGVTISSYVYLQTNSNLTLQGANGYITTASSITASSFFGDGSQLTGILGTLSSTQTFSGGDTFVSSFTVQSNGRQIILSTSAVTNNILIDNKGNISFSPTLHNSSSTIIPDYQTTNATLGPCITGSTLTITTTGGRVEAIFTGIINNLSIGGVAAKMNILEDGGFPRNLSDSAWLAGGSSAVRTGASFSYLFDAPAAGSHSFCLTMASLNGTEELMNDSGHSNLFYVQEIK